MLHNMADFFRQSGTTWAAVRTRQIKPETRWRAEEPIKHKNRGVFVVHEEGNIVRFTIIMLIKVEYMVYSTSLDRSRYFATILWCMKLAGLEADY